jgi:3,4-dihydroxy 2-butanone 4-phosphate synthase / GTP cyclohydrolase II
VRVLSNNPAKLRTLQRCGLEVVERVALEVQPAEAAMRYLRTKKEKMGHLINVA